MTEWNDELGSFVLKKEYKKYHRIDLINYIGEIEELLIWNAGSSIREINEQLEQIQEIIFNMK